MPPTGLRGSVRIDGSSTVFPITEAVAEELLKTQPRIRVTIGVSGTGGGFKKFALGETDLSNASRPIKEVEEKKAAAHGVAFIELPIAFDGLSIVTHPKNAFIDHLTVAELKKIWEPGSQVTSWRQVREGFPDLPLRLYGPGTDSGTFDYFTEAINGKAQACRSDFTASEDDNVLVRGISGDPGSLGFFGYSYYEENKEVLKLIPIKAGANPPVLPSVASIRTGTYAPLSRPVFIYVAAKSAGRPEVEALVRFYLENAPLLTRETGFVPLPEALYEILRERFERRILGSVYTGLAKGHSVGQKLEVLYARKS